MLLFNISESTQSDQDEQGREIERDTEMVKVSVVGSAVIGRLVEHDIAYLMRIIFQRVSYFIWQKKKKKIQITLLQLRFQYHKSLSTHKQKSFVEITEKISWKIRREKKTIDKCRKA